MCSISRTIKICKKFLRFAVWRSWKIYSELYIRSSIGQMDVFVVFRIIMVIIMIFFYIYLFSYLFCLAWISFDIVASMCVNALLCVMDAILRRPDECVRRVHDKRIIFDNFIKTFWVSVVVSSSKLQWSLRSLFKKLARF